jgi:hypothetical protein
MPTASIVFLTPLAALVALAMLLPLAAFVIAERRVATVRRLLTLPPPRTGVDVAALVALALVVLLLALAAAQPALSSTRRQDVRTDAEALFVVDTSQSMAASSGPSGRRRLERATAAASRLRAAIPGVPAGVATLTDRVLPNLLPVADPGAFGATLRNAIAINQPPPREDNLRATSFAALAGVPSAGYFRSSAKRRAIVLLTDGETGSYDTNAVAKALGGNPRTDLLAVQLWRGGEAIYASSGRSDPNYRPDPQSREQLAGLADATGGRTFTERNMSAAAASLQTMLGNGPTKTEGRTRTTRPLAPYVALLALVPLALIFRGRVRGRVRKPGPEEIRYR